MLKVSFNKHSILYFVFGLLLLGCLTFSYIQYLQRTQALYYKIFDMRETFSWKETKEGIFRIDAKDNYDSVLLSTDVWKNFELSLTLLNARNGGLIFNYRDNENFHFIYFNAEERLCLWAVTAGGKTSVLMKAPFPYAPRLPCVLKGEDNTVKLFISDNLVSELGLSLLEGKLGFILKDASFPKIVFSDIAIKGNRQDGQFIERQHLQGSIEGSRQHLFGLIIFYFALIAASVYLAFLLHISSKNFSFQKDQSFEFRINKGSVIFLHLIIALALFWPFVFRREILVSSFDNFGEIFPLFFYSKHSFWQIFQGESLCLWNSYVHNGVPFFSNHWNMIFYPLNWLVFLFPDKNVMPALTFRMLVEVFLIGILSFGFFSEEIKSKRWALFSSVVYQMCSFLIFSLTVFPTVSLYFSMTLYLYVLWSMPKRSVTKNFLWVTISAVFIFTSANMAFIFYAGIVLIVLTVYRFISLEVSLKEKWHEFYVVAGSVFLGFLICAVRLIPCALGILESNRIIKGFYTLHDRLFLIVRLFVPEIIGFKLNPLTAKTTNIIFQSIDLPSNPQNAFFAYFGIIFALLLILSLFMKSKGPYAFWKTYAWVCLGITLLFQPIWGILSVLLYPMNHYSYHIIILPLGLCVLAGLTGKRLESGEVNISKVAPNFILGLFLIQALLAVIATYLVPSTAFVTRFIFILMILWYVFYNFFNRRQSQWRPYYLQISAFVLEALFWIWLLFISTVVFIKPIPRKEEIFVCLIIPLMFFLVVLLTAIRIWKVFFREKTSVAVKRIFVAIMIFIPGIIALLFSNKVLHKVLNIPALYRNYYLDFSFGELRFLIVTFIGISLFLLYYKQVLAKGIFVYLLIIVSMMELLVFNARFDSVVAPSPNKKAFYSIPFPYRDIDDKLRGELDLTNYRAHALDKGGLNSNKALIFKVPSYTGIIGYMPIRFSNLVKSFGYPPTTVLIYPRDSTDNDRFLDLSAVKYVFKNRFHVETRPTALSRVSLFYSYRIIGDDRKFLSELQNPSFNPQQEVLLAQMPDISKIPQRKKSFDPVPIVEVGNDSITVSLKTKTPAILLFSESYHKGWRAFVDEKQVPIYLANYNFMAIAIDAGEHTVRFEFRPASFFIFRNVSRFGVLGFILILLLLFFLGKRNGEVHY